MQHQRQVISKWKDIPRKGTSFINSKEDMQKIYKKKTRKIMIIVSQLKQKLAEAGGMGVTE